MACPYITPFTLSMTSYLVSFDQSFWKTGCGGGGGVVSGGVACSPVGVATDSAAVWPGRDTRCHTLSQGEGVVYTTLDVPTPVVEEEGS